MITRLRRSAAHSTSFLALGVAIVLLGPSAEGRASRAPGDSTHKLDRHLRHTVERDGDAAEQRVIIQVDPTAAAPVDKLLRARGDKVIRFHGGIGAFTVRSKHLRALANHPGIKSISVDAPLDALQTIPPPSALLPTNQVVRDSVSAPSPWTGAGVGVALVDSGIEPSADFAGRISAFYDFTRGGVAAPPYDDYGHGTHIAGLIGGSGALSNGAYAGIAPNVRFVGLKVLNGTGGGYTSDVISAIEFVTANRAALGIHVINLSLGHPPFESAATDPLVQAVEAAVRAGIVVVASAGNYGRNPSTNEIGYAGIASPGNAPSALTVGSFMTQETVRRSDDRMNGFSSRGPTYYDGAAKPDIVAPGTG